MKKVSETIFTLVRILLIPLLFLGLAYFSRSNQQREYIHIVGSSTVFPFSTVLAEHFARTSPYTSPLVERNGTGIGIKLFCAGLGAAHPDVVNASRPMRSSEKQLCAANQVGEVEEVLLGQDGIVIAQAENSPPLQLTLTQLFLAIAERVPQAGQLVANPYQTWQQLDPSLPNSPIVVFGPSSTSGTYDVLVELALHQGAKQLPELRRLAAEQPQVFNQLTSRLREDGGYVEVSENDNMVIQKLRLQPATIGVIGYSFYEKNCDDLKALPLDGVLPAPSSLADSSYPLARPLYVYLKKGHYPLTPGLQDFAAELHRARQGGSRGYLAREGIILIDQPAAQGRGTCSQH